MWKEKRTENFLLLCIRGYFILRATGRSGPENKLWFRIDGPGSFLLTSGGTGCKSTAPCHLYFVVKLKFRFSWRHHWQQKTSTINFFLHYVELRSNRDILTWYWKRTNSLQVMKLSKLARVVSACTTMSFRKTFKYGKFWHPGLCRKNNALVAGWKCSRGNI